MLHIKRRVGLGTLALPLIAIGMVWSFTFRGFCLGDTVLSLFGVQTWSSSYANGIHYTVFYSLILIIPALILALRFNKSFGAKAAKFLAAIICIFFLYAALSCQMG